MWPLGYQSWRSPSKLTCFVRDLVLSGIDKINSLNSFIASRDLCGLPITFANSLVKPFDTLLLFLKDVFLKNKPRDAKPRSSGRVFLSYPHNHGRFL